MQRVPVDLGERSYEVVIGQGVLDDPSAWRSAVTDGTAMVVTNTTVAALFLKRLEQTLLRRHRLVHSVVLPDGEQHKDWTTLSQIFFFFLLGLTVVSTDVASTVAVLMLRPLRG